jgi:protein-S-isoprenylcysteine O-methyltransferase Ste14
MKLVLETIFRIALFGSTLFFWLWVVKQRFSNMVEVFIIIGGVLLVFPLVGLGRMMLDKRPTISRTAWITTFVHFSLMIFLGAAIIRAVITRQNWRGWVLPIPIEIGLPLVIITGAAAFLTVVNLTVKGLGAPFAIALTRKLTADWIYGWTRNPMVLATLVFLFALGIWFQSALFVLWVLILVTPAWLVFVKVYEERELEIRFGASYLEYRAKTPLLFPRKPKA